MDFIDEHPFAFLLFILATATAVIVAAVSVTSNYVGDYTCSKKAIMLQTEYQYGFWEGCWIKANDNTWVEYTTIRNVGGN